MGLYILMSTVFCQGHALAPLALKKSIWPREIPLDGPLGASVFSAGANRPFIDKIMARISSKPLYRKQLFLLLSGR